MDPIINHLIKDQKMRIKVTTESFLYFFHIYFSHYVTYPTAQFQKEIIALLEDQNNINLFITAFRGSGKSTLVSMAYVIWCILGLHNKRFVIIASQVQNQSQYLLSNIKRELEGNKLLIQDFGPFYENAEEWRLGSLVLSRFDARISAVSISESIRGPRHKELRPDVIIFDDIENLESTKNKDTRDNTWHYINSELFPLGDVHTRRIGIGNLIHPDSTMVRFKNAVTQGRMSGMYREYPLVNDEGAIIWPEKFPDMKALEKFKKEVMANEADWLREYLLKIVPDGDPLITIDDIHYYSEKELNLRMDTYFNAISVDPAISSSNTADKTGIVIARVFGKKDKLKIYLLPTLVNKRLEMPELIGTISSLYATTGVGDTRVFIESVALQKGIAQMLQHENIPAEEVTVGGQDKRTRLSLTSNLIKRGQIVFPSTGVEELIRQITLFGTERYDDLVDAFTLLVNKVVAMDLEPKNEAMMVPFIDNRFEPIHIGDSLYIGGQNDWADEEDEEIFRNLKKRR